MNPRDEAIDISREGVNEYLRKYGINGMMPSTSRLIRELRAALDALDALRQIAGGDGK